MTGELVARGKAKRITVEATIIRADGTREELGEVAHWDRSRVRQAVWEMKNAAREGWRAGMARAGSKGCDDGSSEPAEEA